MRSPALVRAMRPRQWVKNLLVVAAPLAAGRLLEPQILLMTLLAFAAFCAVSSAVYLINDSADVEADRLHPTKRFRPIAAGELSIGVAVAAAVVLAVAAIGGSALLQWRLGVLLACYLALQIAYAFRLKHEPVLDLCVITTGFVMRAVAGGLAAGLYISEWFLLVAGFGSLFIVASKRYSELHTLGSEAGTRKSLVRYTDTYLRFVWGMAAAITVMAYALWAITQSGSSSTIWHLVSIAPFVAGLLRYAADADAGKAAEPEDIVWGDRVLQVLGLLWIGCVTLGVWTR